MMKFETIQPHEPQPERRSANYKPNIWDYNFIESLNTDEYTGQKYVTRAEILKEDVRCMINNVSERDLAHLELIDNIQRLGLEYLFDKEIKRCLDFIINNMKNDATIEEDFTATALRFRLLRQYGYEVTQDMFKGFINESGSFMERYQEDVKGILNLYEASHFTLEGEEILEEAQAFTKEYLKNISRDHIDPILAKHVAHAMELPLHWRVGWLSVRRYISLYEREKLMIPTLLELAKLNFNMVQATHQTDLKEISRWWKNLGLAKKLSFTRDRLVESFLWTMGLEFRPQYGSLRKWLTKAVNLILTIDDVYDIYGLFDELELFTNTIDRWDVNEMENLPNYMNICSLALYNTTNEIAIDIEKERGLNILPWLKKVWVDFLKALLMEASWYDKGYTPSLEEYLENAWVSSSGAIILVHSFFALRPKAEVLEFLDKNWDLIYNTSMIVRLCNDLGTSKAELERGDVPSSILCYMLKENASEEKARKYIKDMVMDIWKKINKKCITGCGIPLPFIEIILNFARVAHCIYQHGDGFGVPDRETKDQVLSLLIKPIDLH